MSWTEYSQNPSKKRKIAELKPSTLERLSPNVIVYHILVYYEVDNKWGENDLSLFGYFKMDVLRNVWMIFTSIIYWNNNPEFQLKMDFCKVRCLTWEMQFGKNKPLPMVKMKNLYQLQFAPKDYPPMDHFKNPFDIGVSYILPFLQIQPVDSLQILYLHGFMTGKQTPQILRTLDKFVNLIKLQLSYVSNLDTHWTVKNLPKLKALCIKSGNGFKNLGIQHLKSLQCLKIQSYSDPLPDLNCNLTELILINVSSLTDVLFQKQSLLKLKILTIMTGFDNVQGKDWLPLPQLTHLSFCNTKIKNEFFEQTDFTNLTHLRMEYNLNITWKGWRNNSTLLGLETFIVKIQDPNKTLDDFIENSSWIKLKNCHKHVGINIQFHS